jgi:hypothetical protein
VWRPACHRPRICVGSFADVAAPASSSPACDSTICTARRPAKTLVPLGSHAWLRDHVVAGEGRYWNSFDLSIAHQHGKALWPAETQVRGSFACLAWPSFQETANPSSLFENGWRRQDSHLRRGRFTAR